MIRSATDSAATRAAAAVRAGGGPFFLELRSYRFRAHSMFDPQLYRDKAEVEAWKKRGPLVRYTAWLQETGVLHDPELDRIEAEAAAEIEAAVAFAEAGSWEPVEELDRHVYADRATP